MVALSLLGCGGKAQVMSGGSSVGGAAGLSGNTGRAPARHRAAGSSCPAGRAAIHSTRVDPMCDPATSSACSTLFTCTADGDCTNGVNGRCSSGAFGPRQLSCSYDECQVDDDCAGSAPCACRASSASADANRCITDSNCRTDADCGEAGFCSPSQLGGGCVCPSAALCTGDSSCSPGPCVCGDACGHGYFCHTAADTCVDDSDCNQSGSCNYDTVTGHWSCSECWPIP